MDRTTETLARYATSLRYADLSASTVQAAKGHLLDSLGCAIGGYGSEPAAIARRVAPAWQGAPAARLLGEGRATTPEAAAFATSVMIRFLDANDTYIARGSGHPSDMLGALLAAAEVAGASGKDLLLATVIGYEVSGELAMWKGCATATAAKAGLFAAQLAREGMTGPTAAFEGRHGLGEQVTGAFELDALGGRDTP